MCFTAYNIEDAKKDREIDTKKFNLKNIITLSTVSSFHSSLIN